MGLYVAADSSEQPNVIDLCLFLPCRGALGLQTLNVNQPADIVDLAIAAARKVLFVSESRYSLDHSSS